MNRSQLFFAFFLFSSAVITFAQEVTDSYLPMAVEGKTWWFKRRPLPGHYGTLHDYAYTVMGDTTVYTISYKKIYQNDFGGGLPESREYIDDYKRYNYVDSAWHYVAALRDDGSRVYIFREGAEEEEIYYDLSLKEGESFLLPGGGSGKTAFSAAEIVSINGTPRRKLPWYQWYNTPNGPVAVTSGDHIWLEGIGQNHDGFLRAEWQTSVEGSETVLLAVTDGETCIYGALKNLSAIPQVRTTSSSSPALFDLSGRRLSVPPAKGIYIENGRKRVARGR